MCVDFGGCQTPRAVEKRRRSAKEQSSGPIRGSSSVKALRELHHVTTERDQLKFELERTKRALAAAEKKCQDALRAKKAYDKLKTHCDSLQESLDLSERIRVRQKKLLQQLQLQQQRKEKEAEKEKTRDTAKVDKRDRHPRRRGRLVLEPDQ